MPVVREVDRTALISQPFLVMDTRTLEALYYQRDRRAFPELLPGAIDANNIPRTPEAVITTVTEGFLGLKEGAPRIRRWIKEGVLYLERPGFSLQVNTHTRDGRNCPIVWGVTVEGGREEDDILEPTVLVPEGQEFVIEITPDFATYSGRIAILGVVDQASSQPGGRPERKPLHVNEDGEVDLYVSNQVAFIEKKSYGYLRAETAVKDANGDLQIVEAGSPEAAIYGGLYLCVYPEEAPVVSARIEYRPPPDSEPGDRDVGELLNRLLQGYQLSTEELTRLVESFPFLERFLGKKDTLEEKGYSFPLDLIKLKPLPEGRPRDSEIFGGSGLSKHGETGTTGGGKEDLLEKPARVADLRRGEIVGRTYETEFESDTQRMIPFLVRVKAVGKTPSYLEPGGVAVRTEPSITMTAVRCTYCGSTVPQEVDGTSIWKRRGNEVVIVGRCNCANCGASGVPDIVRYRRGRTTVQ